MAMIFSYKGTDGLREPRITTELNPTSQAIYVNNQGNFMNLLSDFCT